MSRFLLTLCLVTSVGCAFAAIPAHELAANGKVVIRFQPASTSAPEGMLVSDGSVYSAEKGFGWDKDLRAQARDRGDGCTGVALIDRAITAAMFTVDLPDGDYIFRVTAGDTGYASGLAVMVEGALATPPVNLRSGQSVTKEIPITAKAGKARISFIGGQQGRPNSVINLIRITPASANPAKWKLVSEASRAYRKDIADRLAAKQLRRGIMRMVHQPLRLDEYPVPRMTVPLGGHWLFMPSQELTDPNSGSDPASSDSEWHVLQVPQFWNPIEWWIYTKLNGTSYNYIRKEIERCEEFTFDYANTSSGWYRRWVEVPEEMRGRRFVLKFDAVASIAEVYWNGNKVGSHVGMFGPFEVEVTDEVRFGGKNLLAVMVASSKADPGFEKDSVGVAVTVNITKDMLNSLPHGWYRNGMAGIWQPVTLEITGEDRIANIFWQPRIDGATIETTIDRKSSTPLMLRHMLIGASSRDVLYRDTTGTAVGGRSGTMTTELSGLKPRLWSPEHPNCYELRTELVADGKVVDEKTTIVGFKTFEARGNRLYLNGKPYYLRGADMPPHGLMPNDWELAQKFMKLMHDGNEMVTRFHMAPPSKVWMDAADKHGVGVSVGETWPWVLMGSNPIPDQRLMEVWKNEFWEVVKANRNHPSLMLWTISNESYFEGGRDPDKERQTEKYRLFSDVIKGVKKLDPGTPVVLHSGYVRNQGDYDSILKPNGLDDGDVDDRHAYYGWYGASPFHINVAEHIERGGVSETRPLISQEASTGYPDNDTGHPVESYIRDHVVPQAWVGRYGTYDTRPDRFLDIHGQITKEYAEKVRRERTDLSGWMLFANCCWFKDVYDVETIAPYPAYWGVWRAYQPILVSLALHDRHFEEGAKFTGEVAVCNDDPERETLGGLRLKWRIFGKSADTGTSGTVRLPDCPYDTRNRTEVEFRIPYDLPQGRSEMTLELVLDCLGIVLSKNEYPLICAKKEWYAQGEGEVIVLETNGATSAYLADLGFRCDSRKDLDWTSLDVRQLVVTGPSAETAEMLDPLSDFVKRGGRVLMLTDSRESVPDLPEGARTVGASGDFVEVFEAELLSGMDPMDMHWWNASPAGLVRVCEKSYQMPDAPGIRKLAQHIQPHGYLRQGKQQIARYTSWPVFEIAKGSGRMIVSSMLLADDPLAKRFTANLLNHLMK